MAFLNSLARVFSTRENKFNKSTSTPARNRSTADLFGSKQSRASRIAALREVLSTPVSDPTLQLMLNSLPSGLRRRRHSRSPDLCSVHAILSSEPLIEIADLLTLELHRRLAHLYQIPPVHLSYETQTYLYQTLRQYRVYFRELYADKKPDCESTLGSTCLACTLLLFFRDKAAVEALAICAKSRRRRGAEWPALLDWLEGGARAEGWEEQWRRDGENMRRDRKKARSLRHPRGENKENEDTHLAAVSTGEENEDAHLAAVKTGGEKYFKVEELDEHRFEDDIQLQGWLYEQKKRAAQFPTESNYSDKDSAYDERGIYPNPFDDVVEYHPNDDGENPSDRSIVMDDHLDHGQTHKEKTRSKAFLSTYETLTGSKASPGVVEQISLGQYEPAEWRRRRL